MKKLMFATALVASAVAFADPINSISFESYNGGETNLTGKSDIPDPGSIDDGMYFLFEGDSDSSVVTNAGAAFTEKTTAYFNGTSNQKFLALDTEGGTLWRSINTLGTDELGTAKSVASTGTYLDTLVQFTVTEDEEPEVGASDKLAIWLGVETNGVGEVIGTNLLVKAAVVDDLGGTTATTFTLNSEVIPGNWYRLTVKAITDITDGEMIPGFQIYIDGVLATSTTPTLTSEYLEVLDSDSHYDDLVAGKYFASLVKMSALSLQGVGFKGTGAVDEIVWTDDPNTISAATIEFTLTYSGDSNVTALGAVTYTIDGGSPETVTFSEGAAQIPQGASVTIAAPTFAQDYELASLTTNTVAVADAAFPFTFTMTEAMTVAITAAQVQPQYPTYVGSDTTLQGQYNTWKATNGADSQSAYEKQFLLNVAPNTTVADDALQIDSITQNTTAGWDIVVSTTVSDAALSDGSTTTYNGYLLVKAANDLAGLESATPVAYPVTAVSGGKVSINVTGGKFMKAVLTTTAPAAGE